MKVKKFHVVISKFLCQGCRPYFKLNSTRNAKKFDNILSLKSWSIMIYERYFLRCLLRNAWIKNYQKMLRFWSKYERMNRLQSSTTSGSFSDSLHSIWSCKSTKKLLHSSTISRTSERSPNMFFTFLSTWAFASLLLHCDSIS